MRLAAVCACACASIAWLAAFALGARANALYPTLGALAALVVVATLLSSAHVRQALVPRARDVALGIALGALSLVATHVLFPVFARVWPPIGDEVAHLYAVAHVTPAVLVPVALIVLAEELLWRGALPRALARDLSPATAALLSTASYTAAQLGAGSWLLALAALGLGALWMACALWTRSLVASVLAHAVWTLGVLGFWPLAAQA